MTDPLRNLPTVRAPGTTSPANVSSGAGAGQAAAASAFRAAADEAQALRRVYQPQMNEAARRQANEDLTNEDMQDRLALRSVVSQEDEVYNNTLRAGLLSRANVEASGRARELSQEYEFDEDGFDSAWTEYLSEQVSALPEEIAPEVELLLDQYADRARTGIRLNTRARDTEAAIASIQESFQLNQAQIHTLIENNPGGYMDMAQYQELEADRNALLEQMAAPQFGLSDVEIDGLRDAALFQEQEVVSLGALDQTIEADGFPAAYDQISDIANSMQLSGDERRQFEQRLNSHVRRQEVRANAERVQADRQRVERERALSDAQNRQYHQMRVAMADGGLSRADIDEAHEAGQISDAHWSTLILGSAANNAERVENQAILSAIIGGDIPADPQNRDHRDAVDMAFRDAMDQLGGVSQVANDPELMRSVAVSTVDQTGIVPASLQSMIRGHIASGSPEQVGPALDLVSTLGEVNPAAANQAFGEAIADAAVYAENVAAGVPPEEATASYLRAQEARLNPATQELQAVARVITNGMSLDNLERVLDRNPLPFFGRARFEDGTPEAAAALARYRTNFETAYTRYGNEKDARAHADAALRRVYGRTTVEGQERVMAYPPENYYPEARGGSGWMQDQLESDVRELAGDRVRNVRLVADGVTASEAQAGFPPSYIVTYQNEDGTIAAAPGRYRFDASSVIAEQERERFDRLNSARAARRRLLDGIESRNSGQRAEAVREYLRNARGGGDDAVARFDEWLANNPAAPIASYSDLSVTLAGNYAF